MNVIIGVQCHAGAQGTIKLNSDSWYHVGDVVGFEGEDSIVPEWPDCVSGHVTVKIREGKWIGYGLRPTLMADCLEHLTQIALAIKYDWVLWTECDSVFFGPIPDQLDLGNFYCYLAGYCPQEWNCGRGPFLHPPFLMDVQTAKRWVESMRETPTDAGNGTPDVFSAIVCERAGIPVISCLGVWSTNGLDMRVKSKLLEARSEREKGAWHIHGIKRVDHLKFILGETHEFPVDTISG